MLAESLLRKIAILVFRLSTRNPLRPETLAQLGLVAEEAVARAHRPVLHKVEQLAAAVAATARTPRIAAAIVRQLIRLLPAGVLCSLGSSGGGGCRLKGGRQAAAVVSEKVLVKILGRDLEVGQAELKKVHIAIEFSEFMSSNSIRNFASDVRSKNTSLKTVTSSGFRRK